MLYGTWALAAESSRALSLDPCHAALSCHGPLECLACVRGLALLALSVSDTDTEPYIHFHRHAPREVGEPPKVG